MQISIFDQILDGLHLTALCLVGQHQARIYSSAVHYYRTGAALPHLAAHFGPCQTEVVANHLEKGAVGTHEEVVRLPVNGYVEFPFHSTPPFSIQDLVASNARLE